MFVIIYGSGEVHINSEKVFGVSLGWRGVVVLFDVMGCIVGGRCCISPIY